MVEIYEKQGKNEENENFLENINQKFMFCKNSMNATWELKDFYFSFFLWMQCQCVFCECNVKKWRSHIFWVCFLLLKRGKNNVNAPFYCLECMWEGERISPILCTLNPHNKAKIMLMPSFCCCECNLTHKKGEDLANFDPRPPNRIKIMSTHLVFSCCECNVTHTYNMTHYNV